MCSRNALRNRLAVLVALSGILLSMGHFALAASIESELGAPEVKMGNEAAAEVAKENKLCTNAAELKHLREIGDKIAAVANKMVVPALYGSSKVTPFHYTFNIIESNDINAFSLPGGHIYVYRGLLNFVQSDQELAGVLGHEITHAAHHHMIYLLHEQAKHELPNALAMLAMIFSRSPDVYNISLGVQLYEQAKDSGYGMQAERDADHGSIFYTRAAGYNPVGLLTFLERLARQPNFVHYGIYRNHPLTTERVQAAKQVLESLHIPINPRLTTKAIKAEVATENIDGKSLPAVQVNGTTIYCPAPADGRTSQQRASQAAEAINDALNSLPTMSDVTQSSTGAVIVRDKPILSVSAADAQLMNKSPGEVATGISDAIRNVIWQQMLDSVY